MGLVGTGKYAILKARPPMIGTIIARNAVARSFEAMNKHDLTTFMSPWHDDGVFIYPGEVRASGTGTPVTSFSRLWVPSSLKRRVGDLKFMQLRTFSANARVFASRWKRSS
jgi:hypothetical protein